jgi:hypothetical protein
VRQQCHRTRWVVLTDDATAAALCDHLFGCVLVAKEGTTKVNGEEAIKVIRSSWQGSTKKKVSERARRSTMETKRTLDDTFKLADTGIRDHLGVRVAFRQRIVHSSRISSHTTSSPPSTRTTSDTIASTCSSLLTSAKTQCTRRP